ncbi:TRAP-type C4-dicarboxylate transport system substrate-binding protein [Neorhizobium galegae]|uniref:TRAP transporter substrate-binding protein n=1 Tax=Neorhizobium galegae TaxID=399 RepID=UPI001AE9EAD2|nr:TRAP transporter substrate-binding protein DctP [Neorhizobium galegae]MBP2562317.1 TRAP-type C4-dicarboxylate transport system substrate-binding protein [Neorhizobium galegae]MDQ0138357.1 TRAP-type C4-dicarboxylate transport system substrate-binding protein [Neorhizobium galegae]
MKFLHGMALALGLGLTGLAAPVTAAEDWKLASAKRAPDIGAAFDQEFANAVVGASGGLGKIEIQFVGNEQEMVQQVLRGRLHFGVTSPLALAAAMPDIAVLNVPYLWISREERDYVYSHQLKDPLAAMFDEKGLVLLSVQEAGYNGVFCKMNCSDPAALKGQKTRVSPSASGRMFWESVSTIPVQLPLSDVWPALEQGLVVAGDLPIGFYSTTPGAAVAQHFVYTDHIHSPWLYFVNKNVWDKIPADRQKAIKVALPTPFSTTDRFLADQDERAQAFVKKGGTLYKLSDEQRGKWAAMVTPNIDKFVGTMSDRVKTIYEAVKKGKTEFAAQKR